LTASSKQIIVWASFIFYCTGFPFP